MGVGRAGREVQRTRPERRDAHARLSGKPPMCRRHERGRLLMTSQNELDLGVAKRLDDIEIFLARHAEDAVDTLILQSRD
jgi:hypothetical protein